MILETERLILRKFTNDDLEAFALLMADPEVMRFSIAGPMREKQMVKEYLQKRILEHYSKFGFGLYAAIHKDDNCLIGYVGLIRQPIDGENKVELAYRLHPHYWRKGLATEAALAVSHYAFDQPGISDLISIIDPKNVRSLDLAKRIGMRYWKEAVFHDIPVHIYALKKTESQSDVTMRNLEEKDIEKLAHTFTAPWTTYEAILQNWKQYFKEQQQHIRTVCVIVKKNEFLGYGSLLRISDYPYFKDNGIPEINAVWIAEKSRRQGLGKMLITQLEDLARQEGYKTIGIGVGLYKDYGSAQKLYFQLGYVPDGNGITYKCKAVVPGEKYPVDDDLIFWLTKALLKDRKGVIKG